MRHRELLLALNLPGPPFVNVGAGEPCTVNHPNVFPQPARNCFINHPDTTETQNGHRNTETSRGKHPLCLCGVLWFCGVMACMKPVVGNVAFGLEQARLPVMLIGARSLYTLR